jgi:hypothetical protein
MDVVSSCYVDLRGLTIAHRGIKSTSLDTDYGRIVSKAHFGRVDKLAPNGACSPQIVGTDVGSRVVAGVELLDHLFHVVDDPS